ncbi:hypothetical protein Lfu02_49720 [Longispora fulva]|uniref:DNA-binding GntR family transcriptional regulator n=1 Tax=Longispora fulva TaxID=619741 RepID=A0A8J7GD43_9ACTN|nr:UTRA domain-containing protein [Longispora fulva]MBG6138348.1 DNA-binding GntR family transcriptional regulator [Longispora fulva]GIG60600.1 hypothetical protein Lfu02_49720 [Longispora fulva]
MSTTELPIRRFARNRAAADGDQRGFYADLAQKGIQWQVTTTIDPAKSAPTDVAELLGVPEGTPVLARIRHMATTDTPIQLATSWFAPDTVTQFPILAEQETGPGGMYSRFEDAGITLHHEDVVSARAATQAEIEALRLEAPVVMTILRNASDADSGRVLEVGTLVLAAGRQELIY